MPPDWIIAESLFTFQVPYTCTTTCFRNIGHTSEQRRSEKREIQVKPNRTILVGGQSRWTGKATRGTQVHAEVEEAGGNGGPCHCHRERPAWQVELAPAAGDGLVLMRMVFSCRFGARSMALCCAHLVRWESMLRKTGELISRSWRARWRTALSCQLLTPRKFIIGYPQKKKKGNSFRSKGCWLVALDRSIVKNLVVCYYYQTATIGSPATSKVPEGLGDEPYHY